MWISGTSNFCAVDTWPQRFPKEKEATLRLALAGEQAFSPEWLFHLLWNGFFCLTWVRAGESTNFSELLLRNCLYSSSRQTTGRRGGSMFSDPASIADRQRQSLFPAPTYRHINLNTPVLCLLVYHLPQFNKDFIKDFTDFVAGLTVNFDQFLIAGDFNILHDCCESRPFRVSFSYWLLTSLSQ